MMAGEKGKAMIIEIYKPWIKKHGSVDACIKKGWFTTWTPKRIKEAFNFGQGTEKDFERYQKDNAQYCIYRKDVKR